jgi:hypothetical protein
MKMALNNDNICVQELQKYTQTVIRDQESDAAAIEGKISGIMQVFRCIKDKDMFEYLYKLDMSVRLLQGKKINETTEQELIKQFKIEVGASYMEKVVTMLKDINHSKVASE